MSTPDIRAHVRHHALRTALTFLVGALAGVGVALRLQPTRHVPLVAFQEQLEAEGVVAHNADARGLIAPVLDDVVDRLNDVQCPAAPVTNARIAAYLDSLKQRNP